MIKCQLPHPLRQRRRQNKDASGDRLYLNRASNTTVLQTFAVWNASRRLFSDRFFTSCFRPEFYTRLGVDWVNHNGPGPVMIEPGMPNGHKQPVSPMKRVLLRNIPELKVELDSVVNAFDPWARDRNRYYDLQWKARPGTESDDAFPQR